MVQKMAHQKVGVEQTDQSRNSCASPGKILVVSTLMTPSSEKTSCKLLKKYYQSNKTKTHEKLNHK